MNTQEISTDPIDWIVRIKDVVNDSRLYPYPRNRKWAIQFKNPVTGKKKTLYIYLNANWLECSKDHAIRTIAEEMRDGMDDNFKEYYSNYTGEYNSEEYPRRMMKMLYTYCRNLYNDCLDFFPEDVMKALEEYA